MLGIDWLKIVIHFVVFAVLAVGLYLLLYKPVLKFIRSRQENIQKGLDDGKAMQEEAAGVKAEYEGKLSEAEAQSAAILADAEAKRREILDEAARKAEEEKAAIRSAALAEAAEAKRRATEEMEADAGKVAVDLAGEILGREISAEENEQLIRDCLRAWSDHDD